MDEDYSGEWGDRDSGPFCKHWSHPADCDERCICGHLCGRHFCGEYCKEEGCDCEQFRDVEVG